MRLKSIQLTNNLTNFSEKINLDFVKSEYENSGTINYFISAIIPQKNDNYSFNFRRDYYENLLNQIHNFSCNEQKVIILLCITKSYRDNLVECIDTIMEMYNEICDYYFENRYFEYLKYQLEFQLFTYYAFETEEETITSVLRERVDEGNIKFKNY